jgi:hypothetical protein
LTRSVYIFTIAVLLTFSCNVESHKAQLEEASVEPASTETYTNENMTIHEFVDWCADEDHKLNKTKEISDMKYNLSYLPAEAMAFLELRKESIDISKFEKTKADYMEMTYFNFRIEALNTKNELLKYRLRSAGQYEDRIKYMAFGIENDIYLVQGKDTLHPGLCHFERIFEVAPYATVMLAFDNKQFNKDEEFTLMYNDRLFEKGFVKFNYKNKQLINLPKIIGL